MSEISKCSSDGECGSRLCYCNNVVRNRTSWTSKNPGRRFETCAKYKVRECFSAKIFVDTKVNDFVLCYRMKVDVTILCG